MRILVPVLLLAVAGLAGCTLPEEDQGHPLLGVCPQWVVGPWSENRVVRIDGDGAITFTPTDEDGALLNETGGFPLDRYTVMFEEAEVEGRIEMKAFADQRDERRGILDLRDASAPKEPPFLAFDSGAQVQGHTFTIGLSAVQHGTAAAPDALRLEFETEAGGRLILVVTAWYRVCGAPV